MVNVNAEVDTTAHTANTKVPFNFNLIFIAQASSKFLYYFLVLAVLLLSIGGIVFYIFRVRGQIKRGAEQMNDDPNSIIGRDPEPAKQGKYGFQRD